MRESRLEDGEGRGAYREDPVLGYALRANFQGRQVKLDGAVEVRTNAWGCRDDPFPVPPPAGARVWLGLGDSFGFGHGVEQSEAFFQVAEAALRAGGEDVYIHNASVVGYCQRQQLELLGWAEELGASGVLLAVCTANDVLENGGLIERGERDQQLASGSRRGLEAMKVSGRDAWWRRSTLLSLAAMQLGVFPQRVSFGSAAFFVLDQTRDGPSAPMEEAFARTRELLDAIAARCREGGVELLVVGVPTLWECSEADFARSLRVYGRAASERTDRLRVTRFYAAWCREAGVPFLNMAERFGSEADPRALYLRHDRHFNAAGHRLLGEALAEFVRGVSKQP